MVKQKDTPGISKETVRALRVSASKKVKIPAEQYLDMINKWGRPSATPSPSRRALST